MPVAFSDVEALPAASPVKEYRYGDAPSQFARLWLPVAAESGQDFPVVVLLHGGCWLQQFGVAHMSPVAAALTAQGFAVWAPEYRRVGEQGGGWPGTAEDVYAAISALQTVSGVDLQRVLLAGHSAGGQLALWAASQAQAFAADGIMLKGVAGLAAITDLEAYARGSNSCETVTPQFMGGTPEEVPEFYAAASPARLGLQLPTILLHGSADPLVAPSHASAVAGAEVINIDGAGHFDLIHPGTEAFEAVLSVLLKLLEATP
ncbi:alpha/beta fold hydrolase [Haliea sp. E1-2-M8]|uniref:alpha/beta hydrolase family protein n=1 Tax=Haliea sp. E1-2-M8 TaxID=3064706 RepID=UPI002728EC51|nr:alpha/beta fold hydrolase [Haliea sp. E1-2-M8]MDO8862067.1 alpha/beta fold hydrolase [Haliea sp. E1-2-M8]